MWALADGSEVGARWEISDQTTVQTDGAAHGGYKWFLKVRGSRGGEA